MFRYRLTRLPFFLISAAHAMWEDSQLKVMDDRALVLILASLPLMLVFVIWPRLRDCDWPWWMGFLLLVPYLGSLIGLALLFAPSKVFNRRDEAAAKAAVAEDAEPQIAGTSCAECGAKIIMATDGVIRDRKVVCKDCDAKRQPETEEGSSGI